MAFLVDAEIITKIKVGRKTHPSRGTTYAFTCKRFKTYEVQMNPDFTPNAKEKLSALIEERSNHPLVEIYKANVGRYSEGWDALRQQRYQRMVDLAIVDPAWELSPRHPEVPSWEEEAHKEWQERRMEVYAAQITCMDRNISRIIEHLKASGEYENTLFIYQQDNGGCHVEYTPKRTGSWTKPFTTDGKKNAHHPRKSSRGHARAAKQLAILWIRLG